MNFGGRSGFRVAVLGAGAWGSALSCVAASGGHAVRLWARDPDVADAINLSRRNDRHLPGVILPESVSASAAMADVLDGVDVVLAATPAQTTRTVLAAAAAFLPRDAVIILCAKGIERGSGQFQSAIASEILPGATVAVLSGPGFAGEVACGLPTAVTLAARRPDDALTLAATLSTPRFRLYAADDMAGVEAGGALKNVIAIAAGAAHGAGLGASASAALVTRGFAEMRRLAAAFGGRPQTLNGLSGIGDLMLTCASAQSRNFAFGAALAAGRVSSGLAEGAATAQVAHDMARAHGIDAPIMAATSALIAGRLTIAEAVDALMARPVKTEEE
jgi:glycerol-3-phosphate dehydrogenase (NAD(P)+)